MPTMLFKTRNNINPKDKPRVYFTCHPGDFDAYFDKIREDIFNAQDVALYYTQDMTESFDPEHLETDLGQMNLFVVPVTWKLLSQPNRAMDEDIAYAREKEIPILPFMMEPGLDEVYARPEKFGQRQYLSPNFDDATAIRYEDKLKKYLGSVLISDEMAQRVRDAFDAYIFLSYRKKDRKYANELMKLIHNNRQLWDIAIWYDEFLTPGESFEDNIKKALESSKLFALLVTPNVLEEPDGKPNFVMGEEYPAAVKAEKTIVPAQMVQTDRAALEEKFPGIPACSDPEDEAVFQERLLRSIKKAAVAANDADPEHNFLIGLAYLEGIDVEVNRQRGIELITMAAEADLPEAMEKLCKYYSDSSSASIDYPQALKWAKRFADHHEAACGMEAAATLEAWEEFANLNNIMGLHAAAKAVWEKVYEYRCMLSGEMNAKTLWVQQKLADTLLAMGEYFDAGNMLISLFNYQRKVFGNRHVDVAATWYKLAALFNRVNSKNTQERMKRIHKDITQIANEILKKGELQDLPILDTLAKTCVHLHDFKSAFEWKTEAYTRRRAALGEENPDTINALASLAEHYFQRALYLSAWQLFDKVLALRKQVYGPEHPCTLDTYRSITACCNMLGQYRSLLQTAQTEYELRCKSQGPEHPDTLSALCGVANTCIHLLKYKQALECYRQAYNQGHGSLGEAHEVTLRALDGIVEVCTYMGNFAEAKAWQKKKYEQICGAYGEKSAKARSVQKSMKELEEECQKSPVVRQIEMWKLKLEADFGKQYLKREEQKWMKTKGISHLL